MDEPPSVFPLFGKNIDLNQATPIDLSASNTSLADIDLDDQHDFEAFMNSEIQKGAGVCGIGGYLENRVIYRRSAHFESAEASRCIHLGIDVWLPAETPVFAPVDGVVHSFGINDNYADYGGTLILQHMGPDGVYWTLYGHISHDSIEGLIEGDIINKGDMIARLGSWDENGNWPPHLHFQVITDLLDNQGDFPGVCRTDETQFFKEICPDPMKFLNL